MIDMFLEVIAKSLLSAGATLLLLRDLSHRSSAER